MSYFLIFIYSLLIDTGAVLFTRSVQGKRIALGMFVTGSLASLTWASTWMVMQENDRYLMVASVVGHVIGYVIGMLIPVRDESETGHPTSSPGSQSSDPS